MLSELPVVLVLFASLELSETDGAEFSERLEALTCPLPDILGELLCCSPLQPVSKTIAISKADIFFFIGDPPKKRFFNI